jgi:hypothetical protein
MVVYSSQIQKGTAFSKRARSIAIDGRLKADCKNELIYLRLLRAAESLGYGLITCNRLDAKSVPMHSSPRNRLMKVFKRIVTDNLNFFPVVCNDGALALEWESRTPVPIRGAMTRQGLLELATKAELIPFARSPLHEALNRLLNLRPEEWNSRFEKLPRSYVLTASEGIQYLDKTHTKGIVTTSSVLGTNDVEKFS